MQTRAQVLCVTLLGSPRVALVRLILHVVHLAYLPVFLPSLCVALTLQLAKKVSDSDEAFAAAEGGMAIAMAAMNELQVRSLAAVV